jgi:hypothetical protein
MCHSYLNLDAIAKPFFPLAHKHFHCVDQSHDWTLSTGIQRQICQLRGAPISARFPEGRYIKRERNGEWPPARAIYPTLKSHDTIQPIPQIPAAWGFFGPTPGGTLVSHLPMDLALGAAVAIGEQWGVPNLRESQLGDWRLRGKEGANLLRPADVKAGRRSVTIPVESAHPEFRFLIWRRTFTWPLSLARLLMMLRRHPAENERESPPGKMPQFAS